jgi:predicted adenine nucleotide alpha hydrolase (AANH) superfamily ATPase
LANLQNELEALIGSRDPALPAPPLLLHACCAPCSTHVLEYLARHFAVSIDFYNPNIFPADEYDKRLGELRGLLEAVPYENPVPFCPRIRSGTLSRRREGAEAEPEGGARCEACFRLRIGHTAELARREGFEQFHNHPFVSPHKDAALLDRIAWSLRPATESAALPSDFKKKGGYQRSIALCGNTGCTGRITAAAPFRAGRTRSLSNR